jgi:glutamate-5-semialdehyde dehydrogenase
MRDATSILALVEREAAAAAAAARRLEDRAVAAALAGAAARLEAERAAVLAANEADLAAAAGTLDDAALDRLRLDDARVDGIAGQLADLSRLPPLEREVGSWTLPNGLEVSERRIPIGAVGANFEARPNVALDVAGQLLKSLNGGVLRTGSAALRTVTVLVDDVLRPALADAGAPPEAIGLVRTPDREGARALVSLPRLLPLVILRGSGESTASLARHAAEHGVRTLAHAEGGGVLYLAASADPGAVERMLEASVDRLGVCNRLNLLLVDRAVAAALVPAAARQLQALGIVARGTAAAREHDDLLPLEERLGHEWASDPERFATVSIHVVDGEEEAARIANEETSALAAAIVADDEASARTFLDLYRGTAAFWQAPTRFTDGHALLGVPETGINVDGVPGPRGPVTYRDLWLRQYRVVGDGTQRR